MGLFSFLKGSGAKLLNKQEEEAVKTKSADEVVKIKKEAMLRAVNDLNLPVKNISLRPHILLWQFSTVNHRV